MSPGNWSILKKLLEKSESRDRQNMTALNMTTDSWKQNIVRASPRLPRVWGRPLGVTNTPPKQETGS